MIEPNRLEKAAQKILDNSGEIESPGSHFWVISFELNEEYSDYLHQTGERQLLGLPVTVEPLQGESTISLMKFVGNARVE